MKGVLLLLVTAIVVCMGNRTQRVHRHRHAKTGHEPERDTGSIILKPGTARKKLFPGYGTNFRYIGEVKNGLDRVTVVTSIPILSIVIYRKDQLYLIIVLKFMETWGKKEVTPNMRLIKRVIKFWHRQNFIKVNKKNYNFYLDNC